MILKIASLFSSVKALPRPMRQVKFMGLWDFIDVLTFMIGMYSGKRILYNVYRFLLK